MNKDLFEKLLERGEGPLLDFKKEFYNLKDRNKEAAFIKDVISFANTIRTETSYIIIGVEETKNGEKILHGVEGHIDDAVLQQKIEYKVRPVPKFQYYEFGYNNRIFGILEIPVKKYKMPCQSIVKLKGLELDKIYFRRGSSNSEAKPEEINEIYEWLNKEEKAVPSELNTPPKISSEEVVGRDNDIKTIYKLLQTSDEVVLVNGMGGIGKTTVAKYFLNYFRGKYNYVCWIDVGTNVKDAFVDNIQLIDSLALRDDIEALPRKENTNKIFQLIANRLRQLSVTMQKPKNLLIIDNASEDLEHTQTLDHISLKPNWHVLVTSREKLEGFAEYEIGFLTEDDAVTLFYRHYHLEKDDKIVRKIIEMIDYHTLVVEIVSRDSQSRRLGLLEILDQLKKKGTNISSEARLKLRHNYNQKIINAFEYLVGIYNDGKLNDDEKDVLKKFSILPPVFINYKNNIGENIIDLWQIKDEEEKNIFTGAINNLVKRGWLQWDREQDAFKMHMVVQEVMRYRMTPTYFGCSKLVGYINNRLELDFYSDNPFNKFRWIKYGKSILDGLKNPDVMAISADEIWNKFNTVGLTGDDGWEKWMYPGTYRLLNNLGALFRAKGNYEVAKNYLKWALLLVYLNKDRRSFKTVKVQLNLALLLIDLGDNHAAINLLLKNLEFVIEQLQFDHPYVTETPLATEYISTIAKLTLKGTLRGTNLEDEDGTNERIPFESIDISLITKFFLSGTFNHNEHIQYANRLLSLSYMLDLKNFGDNHPVIPFRKVDLAETYILDFSKGFQGNIVKSKEALEMMESAYEQTLRLFGELHSRTNEIREKLIYLYLDYFNDFQKASKLIEISTKCYVIYYGKNHPKIGITYFQLALAIMEAEPSGKIFSLSALKKTKKYLLKAKNILTKKVREYHPTLAEVNMWLHYIDAWMEDAQRSE